MDDQTPTQAEIRECAAEIRGDWDEREHRQRAGLNPDGDGWEVQRARIEPGAREPE